MTQVGALFALVPLGHVDIISFNDILKLLPKSGSKPGDSSNKEALLLCIRYCSDKHSHLLMQGEPALEWALILHVDAAALHAHITTDRAPRNATQFATPEDSAHAETPNAPLMFVSGSKLPVKNTTCSTNDGMLGGS